MPFNAIVQRIELIIVISHSAESNIVSAAVYCEAAGGGIYHALRISASKPDSAAVIRLDAESSGSKHRRTPMLSVAETSVFYENTRP